jgi:hypothetical protein
MYIQHFTATFGVVCIMAMLVSVVALPKPQEPSDSDIGSLLIPCGAIETLTRTDAWPYACGRSLTDLLYWFVLMREQVPFPPELSIHAENMSWRLPVCTNICRIRSIASE